MAKEGEEVKSPGSATRKTIPLSRACSEKGILAMRILLALERGERPPTGRETSAADGRAIEWVDTENEPRLRCSTLTICEYPWSACVQSQLATRLEGAGLVAYEYGPSPDYDRYIRLTKAGREWIISHDGSPYSKADEVRAKARTR